MSKKTVIEDYKKKFKMLQEYAFYTPTLTEDGEQEVNTDGAPMSELPQDTPVQTEQPNLDNMNLEEPSTDLEGGEDLSVEDDVVDDIDSVDTEDNVEEIDITELVDGQEEAKNEIQQLADKFQQFTEFGEKLTQKLDDIITKSNNTEEQLKNLEQEVIKRNPTDVETLNLRSLQSNPFTEKPAEYWEKKVAENPKYSIGDEEEVKEKEYILRKGDVENVNGLDTNIFKSFNENIFHSSLKDILDF